MSLQALEDTLKGYASDGSLTLGKLAGTVSSFALVNDTIPFSAGVGLTAAAFALDDGGNRLTITDTVTWAAIEGVSIRIAITPDTGTNYIASAALALPASTALQIPGISWFRLDGLSLSVTTQAYNFYINAITAPVDAAIGAMLHISTNTSDIPIPIRVEINSDGRLLLHGNFSAIEFPSITQILSAFGDSSGVNLPPSIDDLTRIAMYDVSVGFDPIAGQVFQIGLVIGNAAGVSWEIIKSVLRLTKYRIGLTISDPLTRPSVGGLISAQLVLGSGGDAVTIDVYALHPPSAGWDFKGETGVGSPVKIGAILAGLGSDFGVTLPASLASLELRNFSIEFNTDTKVASTGFELDFTISDTPIALTASITLTPKGSGYTPDVIGELDIGSAKFQVTYNATTFTASWSDTANPLQFETLASKLGFKQSDLPAIPPSLQLALTSASLSYDTVGGVLTLTAASQHYGNAIFIAQKGTPPLFAFGLQIHLGITLADIPLVGDKLPDAANLGISDAGIWILSRNVTKAEVAKLVYDKTRYPALPDADITSRVLLYATLSLGGGEGMPLELPLDTPSPAATGSTGGGAAAGAGTGPAAPPSDGTRWISVQKQFGVFQFNRIGFRYANDSLGFALDAGMALGPMTLSMDGLSIESPLTRFSPSFDLVGLGLAYVSPPLEISGALLKLPAGQLDPSVRFQFDGTAVVKAETFSLSAIGSYAQEKSGDPSLFVFAQLETPLGGPPAFFVTGVMAGFGFNRSLELPAQDEVSGFPLLVLAQPPSPGQPAQKQDPSKVLDILEGRAPITPSGRTQQWIRPQPGQYWLAVGLEFTSFELVLSRALLIAEFGNDLQFALLGLSTMRLPQAGPVTYAYVELQLRAVLRPQDGSFQFTAILSNNSYVIAPECHLTGGFAFYLWFGSNPHAGQFVVTLGGYSPAFKPPDYFPTVPRLGFNWAVSSDVSIKGDAYFALTTSCAMAGGGLEVLYSSGDLKAWFTAHADLLVSWHPFFFLAHLDVSIGVSYRLNLLFCHKTISVSISASVDLWGPPTGGEVHVDLTVVSFTVSFGADRTSVGNTALGWTDFKPLLPAAHDVCKITISDGLYKSQDSDASTSGKRWVVRAGQLEFFTQSAIPASQLHYGEPALAARAALAGIGAATLAAAEPPSIAIRPMNLTGVTSVHSLRIRKGSTAAPPIDAAAAGWTLVPRTQSVPQSLWGAPPVPFTQVPARPSADVVADQPVGYTVNAPPPALGASRGLVALTLLAEDYLSPAGKSPARATVVASTDYVGHAAADTIHKIAQIMDPATVQAREGLFAALSAAGIYSGDHGALDGLARAAAHVYSDSPMQET